MNKTLSISKRISIMVLALVILFTTFPHINARAAEEMGCGGLEFAEWGDITIYDARSGGNVIGKIHQYESFTVITRDVTYIYVDYSTSKGAKQGYIHIDPEEWGGRSDAVAKVKTTSNVYYGRNGYGAKYQKAGAVYAGEYVAVIAVSDNWAYVEYNTTGGRKRGYVPFYNLQVSLIHPDEYKSIYNDYDESYRPFHETYFFGDKTVYSGPTDLYAPVGSISDEFVFEYGDPVCIGPYKAQYIEYYVDGTDHELKSGFVLL